MVNSNSKSPADRVDSAWSEIEALMKTLDPSQLSHLAPPATDNQIAELSRSVGLDLPSDIKAHLKRHNGCVGEEVFVRFHFLSTESIVTHTQNCRKEHQTWLKENPGKILGFSEDGGWDENILMLGVCNFAGMQLAIEIPDCETSLPYLRDPINYSMPLARDFATYLESFAYHLRNGKFADGIVEFDHWAEWSVDGDPTAR